MFACDPPAESVPLLEEIAADLRPQSLRAQLFVMAEADQRDLSPRIAVPTLLIWGWTPVSTSSAAVWLFAGTVMLAMIQHQ